jgi:hypothetical protein
MALHATRANALKPGDIIYAVLTDEILGAEVVSVDRRTSDSIIFTYSYEGTQESAVVPAGFRLFKLAVR